MTSELHRYRCLFLSCQQQKAPQNSAAVTSLRSFLFCQGFNQLVARSTKKSDRKVGLIWKILVETYMKYLVTLILPNLSCYFWFRFWILERKLNAVDQILDFASDLQKNRKTWRISYLLKMINNYRELLFVYLHCKPIPCNDYRDFSV